LPAGVSIASGRHRGKAIAGREGDRGPEGAGERESRLVGIVRDEVATVAMLVKKGLEQRPRLLNLEREATDLEVRRGEITAQIRAPSKSSAAETNLLKPENARQNEIAQSLREAQNQIFSFASDCRRPTTSSGARR
jgi:HlyD family secretion protein